MQHITFHLCDLMPELVAAWRDLFDDYDNFRFYHGDIFALYENLKETNDPVAIVSPANSFGELSGGIDKLYLHYFGYQLEQQIQHKIINEKHGELIIGDAITVELPDYINGYMVVAPTMRVPMNINNTVNIYLAFKAILIALEGTDIKHVIIPGLGTGIGKVSPTICANQMYQAYNKMLNPDRHFDLLKETQEHLNLIN